MGRPVKTQYKVINEAKYAGNVDSIICRSSWESFVCRHLDNNKHVRKWASEEIVVNYYYPVDGKTHRYFIDFYIEMMNGDKFLIEVKPFAETQKPVAPKRKTKKAMISYQEKMLTFAKNAAKWEAAKLWANKNNMTFLIWTENELKSLGGF